METGRPSVYAIILNWNNFEDTAASIDAISTVNYQNLELIIVDNGSTDGSGARLSQEFPDTTVVQTGQNRGFAGGMNAGIIHAMDRDADYVWLLNNDIRDPDPDLLDVIVSTFEKEDGIGILTPQINEYPDTEEPWFVRGSVGDKTHDAKHADITSESGIVCNDYVPFCSPVFSREVIDTVGLLPQEYFLYFEDVDYCTRAKERGFDIATVTDVHIYHKVGTSSSKATHRYYYFRNRLHYVRTLRSITLPFLIDYVYFFLGTIVYHSIKGNFDVVRNSALGGLHGISGRMERGPVP
ncbi:glycosyltransferase family 2 protein [Halosimplex halobium]|uniref:glycosyltransferase family 2 protein n=1 Tax=Halosimplex halobium TaxID=3396618 RepID=UPI003F57BA11